MRNGSFRFNSKDLPLDPKPIDDGVEVWSSIFRDTLDGVYLKRGKIWGNIEYCPQEVLDGGVLLNDWLS